MKKSWMRVLAAAALLAPVAGFCAEAGQSKTVRGEVLDMACYMGHEAKGSGHAKCAQACLKGGAPAGLLTSDGQVYLLVPDHGKDKAYASLKDLGGDQADVTGEVSSRGGVQAITVSQVAKAK